jgi:hypothetical protein
MATLYTRRMIRCNIYGFYASVRINAYHKWPLAPWGVCLMASRLKRGRWWLVVHSFASDQYGIVLNGEPDELHGVK